MKEKLKKIFIVALTTTLMGQIYFNPFNSPFRLSIGVALLSFFILQFDVPIMRTSIITSIFIFVFRVFIDAIPFNDEVDILEIAYIHLPSIVFYIVFGFVLYQLNIRDYINKPIYLVLFLCISDIISNLAEASVRNEFIFNPVNLVLSRLIITGFIRAILALVFYIALKSYSMLILREEHEERYRSLLLMTANMKAEVFFLTKAMQDIEKAMERSYSIYSELKDLEEKGKSIKPDKISRLKNRLLNLSKDIHEIKKDNQRVIAGIESLFPKSSVANMSILSLIEIIRTNTERYIASLGKDISFIVDYSKDLVFVIDDYYPLISVINNLIINSIEAIEGQEGYVSLLQGFRGDYIFFSVIDNGCGIKEEDLEVIFSPGFSTKYNKRTGYMSTGLGLTHVKQIVEDYYGGYIKVESTYGMGTAFSIYLPVDKIGRVMREHETQNLYYR